jgi:uncharacterized DUF497 family protein
VEIEFDPKKSAKNAAARGLPFDLTRDEFDWNAALVVEDARRDYGERRFLALGPMHGRLHVVCYCIRGGAAASSVFARRTRKRNELMAKRALKPSARPLTDKDGEVRELTLEDFRRMRPIAEVDPGMLEAVKEWRKKVGRPKAEAPKEHISFRLAPEVVEGIKATGPGYNARVEQALREAFIAKGHEPRIAKAVAARAAKRRAAAEQAAKRAAGKRKA